MRHTQYQKKTFKEQLSDLGKFLLNLVSASILILAIIMLIEKAYIPTIFLTFGALILAPFVRDRIKKYIPATIDTRNALKAMLVVGLSFAAATLWNADTEKESLAKKFAQDRERLITALQKGVDAPDFFPAYNTAQQYLSVADPEFMADYNKANEAKAEQVTLNRQKAQERLQTEFDGQQAQILKEMKSLIQEGKTGQAIELFKTYAEVNDPDFQKLGEQAQKEDSEQRNRETERQNAEAHHIQQEQLKSKIAEYAVEPITKSGYPTVYKTWGQKGVAWINSLQEQAALKIVESNQCDQLELLGLSIDRSSPPDHVVFYGDCLNGQRYYVSEDEIKSSAQIVSKNDKLAQITDEHARNICIEQTRTTLNFPSSFDLKILSVEVNRAVTGNIAVTFDFDAKNALGNTLPQKARCIIDDQDVHPVEITNR